MRIIAKQLFNFFCFPQTFFTCSTFRVTLLRFFVHSHNLYTILTHLIASLFRFNFRCRPFDSLSPPLSLSHSLVMVSKIILRISDSSDSISDMCSRVTVLLLYFDSCQNDIQVGFALGIMQKFNSYLLCILNGVVT